MLSQNSISPRSLTMKSFQGKVAAITGAGSGIGRALALQLAQEGAHLALSDIVLENVEQTAQQARAAGANVTVRKLDVADREDVHRWADEVATHFGKVNLVFNNAGVALNATVENITYDEFEWLMNINFWGVVAGTKAFLPHLIASGDGHVINISSIFGMICVPSLAAYNTSKFAVRAFTETLREELDMLNNGVSASCVHPGGINTNISRDARTGSVNSDIMGDPEANKKNFQKFLRTPPEEAARVILRGVRKNERRILIGNDARTLDALQRVLGSTYQAVVAKASRRSIKG